jgi:cytoskeletal protein CcmA (bactofilin family)
MRQWRRGRGPEAPENEPQEQKVQPVAPEQAPEGARVQPEDRDAAGRVQGSPVPGREVTMNRAIDGSEVSVVGRGTKIEGKVAAAGSLRVEGEVKGAIAAKGDVSLSPEGRVEANIEAGSITLAGQVKGDLRAQGDVSLPADSRLDGNIRARNVAVGGVVKGYILAQDRVELGARARVDGDITSERLVIEAGAVFQGRSIMDKQKPQENQ